MYVKLTLRNAKRSINDYLLYIVTFTIFISIMTISNYIAISGNVEAGFQTESLSILIMLILVILIGYMNRFMLKQRSKEFANYVLLGMEKNKLSWMFIFEFWLIGVLCYLGGSLIGIGLSILYYYNFLSKLGSPFIQLSIFIQSIGKTFFYFCTVEFLYAFYIKWNMSKLQISDFIVEKKRGQILNGVKQNHFWGILFILSFLTTTALFLGIVFLPKNILVFIVSFIAIPLSITIFSFYKWLYQYLAIIRLRHSDELYSKNRLYIVAQLTTEIKTNAVLNSIFCICLFFSISAFVTGLFMLQSEFKIFDTKNQHWMGILQISLCIIFIILYFSILSLLQVIDLKRESNNIKVLHYLGKDKNQLKNIMRLQIFIKLFIPSMMSFLLLLIGTPCLNYTFNRVLPDSMNHMLLKALSAFFICFFFVYLLYFFIVYYMSKSFMEKLIL